MVSLSASEPTVSANGASLRRTDNLEHRLIDAFDQIVALLVEAVDGALGQGDLVVIVGTRLILFMPKLDIRLSQPRDESADRVHGPLPSQKHAGAPRAPV